MDDIVEDALALFDFFRELFVRSSITVIRLLRRHSLRAGIGVPPILNLPVEILDSILHYLPDREKILFALTCSSLHYCLAKPSVTRSVEHRRRLLEVLQRDIPRLFYCHICVKMHPFDRSFGPIGSYPSRELPIGSKCVKDKIFRGVSIPHNYDYRLGFHHVQLVMNKHFFGPQHGLPLRAISGHVTSISSSGFTVRQSWRARVIADELFLSATYVISHSGEDTRPTKRSRDTDFDICAHIRTTSVWPGPLEIPVFECCEGDRCRMDSYLKVIGGRVKNSEAHRSCSYCLTEYDITFKGTGRKTQVIITTYHQLGRCRSSDDWKWKIFITAAASCRLYHIPKRATKGYSHGEVRSAWNAVSS